MPQCDKCALAISSRTKQGIFCEACKKIVHASCISKSVDILSLFDNIPGLSWKCDNCVNQCLILNANGVNELLQKKLDEATASIQNQLCIFKSDLGKVTKEILKPAIRPNYSDVIKNRTQPAVIIKPKNSSQSSATTKVDILQHVDPSQNNIQLSRVKNCRDGGVLISCNNSEGNEKFKTLVNEKLLNSYDIKEVSGVRPRLRIVGMTQHYTEDTLLSLLPRYNPNIFPEDSLLRILKVMPTKKNENIFQAIIEVDKHAYARLVDVGHLFIGYDSCTIYDAIQIYRCFKCNEFHHSANKCRNNLSCPLCGENHDLKGCTSQLRKCSNCCKLKLRSNNTSDVNITVDHAVWEKEKCFAYRGVVDQFKRDLLS